jgi:hypothetical protein
MRNRLAHFGGAVLCLGFLPYGPFICAGSVDKSTKVVHVLTGVFPFFLCVLTVFPGFAQICAHIRKNGRLLYSALINMYR